MPNEMELRGVVAFLNGVCDSLSTGKHDLIKGKCPDCEALGEVQAARSLVELDLAFYQLGERQQ